MPLESLVLAAERCDAAGLGTEELGVGGDDGDGLGGGFDQDDEYGFAIGIGDCGNGLGQREDEMEIRHGQDLADLADRATGVRHCSSRSGS